MKNRSCTRWALALAPLALGLAQSRAQSIYATPYAFTNFAGWPGGAGNVDGSGSAARFGVDDGRAGTGPTAVASDSSGNVYVADTYNFTVRKITPAKVVTTLAGSAGHNGTNDGVGNGARFGNDYWAVGPLGVTADGASNVYVADSGNFTIRKITPGGVVTTIAGRIGHTGTNDGLGSVALFGYLAGGMAVDSTTNLYVADTGNHTVRKLTPAGTDWMVTTLAGSGGQSGTNNGTGAAARLNSPQAVAVDNAGIVYVADTGNDTIRKITPAGVVTTLAGSAGQAGSVNGTGSAARFNMPYGVTVDSLTNVYVADSVNSTIRKITPGGAVTTFAGVAGSDGSQDGTGTAAHFWFPEGLAVDSARNIYVTDNFNFTIRKITPSAVVTTLAGLAPFLAAVDGTGTNGGMAGAQLAVNAGRTLYVADTFGDAIRKISTTAVVTTLAGSLAQTGTNNGTGSAARFFNPYGVALDSATNAYVADTYSHTIRKVTPAGVVTTLAGTPGLSGTNDGTGSAARFNNPQGVAADGAGNIYVSDTDNNLIRKVTPGGVATTLAGGAAGFGNIDGIGSAAGFGSPRGIAVDSATNLYVADFGNGSIRKITQIGTNWSVTTLAGPAPESSDGDGPGSAAGFAGPASVAVDTSGNVFVADQYNCTIRKITPAGLVSTVAGTPGHVGGADGIGSAAQFSGPLGVAVDKAGFLYVSDGTRIAKGTPRLDLNALLFEFGSEAVSNGNFHARLTGPPGSSVVVQTSTNLQTWTPIQTNALPSTGLEVSVSLGTNQYRFFRGRLAP